MNNGTILILEDELLIARMYSILFGQAGYSVFLADHSKDIVGLVRSLNPDFIILDNQLKYKQSGFETALQLRHSGNNTPIVFTTGNAEQVAKDFVSKVSCSYYRIKPIDCAELLRFITNQLKKA